MPTDNNVSTNRPWWARLRRGERELFPFIVLALTCAMLVAFVAYATFRLRVTYELQTALAQFQAERASLFEANRREHQAVSERLDELERVLFGDVLVKIAAQLKAAKPPMTAMQVWQRNRDRELRDRLTRLEEWRLALEAKK